MLLEIKAFVKVPSGSKLKSTSRGVLLELLPVATQGPPPAHYPREWTGDNNAWDTAG